MGKERRSWSTVIEIHAVLLTLASFAACGQEAASEGTGAPEGGTAQSPPPSIGSQPPLPPIADGGDCANGSFEVRKVGDVRFQEKDYEIGIATPCEYVLSQARKGITYPIEETATHYIVDSHFELPYIPGVMDAVAFTPGEKNKGWANGLDVEKL
ncbi:MAG: uncharacterized protein K0S65_6500, partial [Labilithrix sp.]|nr:uncharacterized protein [Labilithrix sp.]